MSSLLRYKKSGGFHQLLSLIETFGPQKKEKFLEMIEAESPVWAAALREKMLSLERLLAWPDDTVVGVFRKLPPKNLAFALQGLQEEQRQRIQKYFSTAEQRRLSDVLSESQPKPDEISATLVKVLEIARKMLNEREISPEKIDEKLVIPEDFEARLEEDASLEYVAPPVVPAAGPLAPPPVSGGAAPSSGSPSAEVLQLQRSLNLTLKENRALKEELKVLREKLDQIRKIA